MLIERETKAKLEALGYEVHKSGWPDLLIARDGKLYCLVELKDSGDDLRGNQERVHELLRSAGLHVHVVPRSYMADFLWAMAAATQPNPDSVTR